VSALDPRPLLRWTAAHQLRLLQSPGCRRSGASLTARSCNGPTVAALRRRQLGCRHRWQVGAPLSVTPSAAAAPAAAGVNPPGCCFHPSCVATTTRPAAHWHAVGGCNNPLVSRPFLSTNAAASSAASACCWLRAPRPWCAWRLQRAQLRGLLAGGGGAGSVLTVAIDIRSRSCHCKGCPQQPLARNRNFHEFGKCATNSTGSKVCAGRKDRL